MSYSTYLSHHGIKGQKWGVENGPPYPLNDVVKAIAYRGGELKDGRKAINFTAKDVKKARKIVNKNLKAMTNEDIKEYKDRIMLERSMGEVLGTDTSEKLMRKLKNNAVDAVADSLKTSGTKILTNAEMAAVGEVISATLGPDSAAMITDGLSKYQIQKNKFTQEQTKYVNETNRMEQETAKAKQAQAEKVYDNSGKEQQLANTEKAKAEARKLNAESEEKEIANRAAKDAYNQAARDEADKQWQSEIDKAFEETPKETTSVSKPSEEPETKSDRDFKYTDKEKVNGEWRYEYEDDQPKPRYESWNSEYLLPDNNKVYKSKTSKTKSTKSSTKSSKPKKSKVSKSSSKPKKSKSSKSSRSSKLSRIQIVDNRSNQRYLPGPNDNQYYLPYKG